MYLKTKKQTSRSAVVIYMNIATLKIELSKLTIVWRYYNLKQQIAQAIFADEKSINTASYLRFKILVCENSREILICENSG